MNQTMLAAVAVHDDNDWSDDIPTVSRDTIRTIELRLIVADPEALEDLESVREIQAALAIVESERDSNESIAICTDPARRSEFTAVEAAL